MVRLRAVLLATAAFAVMSCSVTQPIALRTLSAPNPMCLQMQLRGQLVTDDLTGLGLNNDGYATHVTWPYGWTTRTDGNRVALVGRQGDVLAHVGDQVTMGGGLVGDGTAVVCETAVPPIEVAPH